TNAAATAVMVLPPTNAAPAARTNQVAAAPVRPAPPPSRVTNNAFALTNLAAAPEIKARPATTETPLEIRRVDNSFVVVPAQDIGLRIEPRTAIPNPPPAPEPLVTNTQASVSGDSARPPKRGLWERFNPFSGKPKASNGTEVVQVPAATPMPVV